MARSLIVLIVLIAPVILVLIVLIVIVIVVLVVVSIDQTTRRTVCFIAGHLVVIFTLHDQDFVQARRQLLVAVAGRVDGLLQRQHGELAQTLQREQHPERDR